MSRKEKYGAVSILFDVKHIISRPTILVGAVCLFMFCSRAEPAPEGGALSLEGVLDFQSRQRRDMRIFSWKGRDRVFIMSFRTASIQGRTLNRMAAFAEKKGTRGRVLDDRELQAFIKKTGTTPANFYAAHDYRGSQLARFLNQARRRRVRLNNRERELERILVSRGIIRAGRRGKYYSGGRVLISLPANYSRRTRRLLLRHEARHALFFTDGRYRAICEKFWKRELSPAHREFFRRAFAHMSYDPADEYLMINEFQSYILQETNPFENYLRYRARKPGGEFIQAWLRRFPGRLRDYSVRLRASLRAFPLK